MTRNGKWTSGKDWEEAAQYISQSNPRFDLQNVQSRAEHDPRWDLNAPAVITAFILQSAVFLLHRFPLYSPVTGAEENMEYTCARK